MRYLLGMLAAFAAGMMMVVESARLAADGQWVAVTVLGVFVFALFVLMAAASVKAEREAGKESNTLSISAGKAIIGGKLYDIPAQTYRPEDIQ